ncbi:unnamed protein product [Haemonchus placei]|uniref:ATP-binding cassette sub-family D member 3 n=1 Tax=Haemonchus placei TaxID=6290 RepID=A0A0N4WY48_HAEPC|nr:unnamed protein product [Haemonchus placei]
MGVLSKLDQVRLLASSLSFKQYGPGVCGLAAFFAVIKWYSKAAKGSQSRLILTKSGQPSKDKAHVDGAFFMKLWRILKILIPGPFSMEMFYMLLVAVSLLCRTYADLYMIITATGIEASIISRDRLLFLIKVIQYGMAMPAISVTNAILKFGISEIKLRFRERLTKHLYSQYLKGFTFYKMSNLDNRIQNADQLLTQDVDKFCEGLVELYSNLTKPIVDVLLYVSRIGGALGWSAPVILFSYLLGSGVFLTYLRRPIGRLTVQEQALEGEFRFVNSRLIMNSEEIAFYQGNDRERTTLLGSFSNLVNHLRKVILFRFSIGFVDNIVAKYAATVIGWYAVGRPFFDHKNEFINGLGRNQLIQEYYNSGRMMLKLAEALGRLALAGRELTRLSGFTTRVDTLLKVLNDLSTGSYERTMITDGKSEQANGLISSSFSPGAVSSCENLLSGELVICDNVIRFEGVPLVTPNGDVLINSLDFEVPSGRNVLVCGPNGCGKSSLFRILGELWPLFGGRLTKPEKGKLFYVPQRPYMTLGTLRDQVIYPDRAYDMVRKGFTDHDLEEMLEKVQLSHILVREGGWDTVQDWMDVLSGGEKQRIAMARLFYHKPQFAILDECTSAVSVDVEGAMYRICREEGITLFTVSHRKSLWVHHEYFLHMDGRGSYQFEKIDDNTTMFGS